MESLQNIDMRDVILEVQKVSAKIDVLRMEVFDQNKDFRKRMELIENKQETFQHTFDLFHEEVKDVKNAPSLTTIIIGIATMMAVPSIIIALFNLLR